MLERFVNGQDVFIFQPTISCMNLWVLECQITKSTKSQIKLNIELKRQDSQANRNIMFLRIVTPVFGKARQIFFK